MPVTTNDIFDAPVYMGTQELKFDTTRDIGGSGESLAGISAVDMGSGPLLQIRCRGGGNDKSLVRLDPTGIQDGAGNPTVQDGDLLQYRASDQTYHPIQGITQNVVVGDGAGGFVTLQIVSGLIIGVT